MVRTHHLVNRLHDRQHFLVCDLPITIDIVKLERPVQLVFHLPPRRDRQCTDELLEIDHATIICIEHAEHVIGKGRGVAKGEELAVDLLEFLLGQVSGGAVLKEAWKQGASC